MLRPTSRRPELPAERRYFSPSIQHHHPTVKWHGPYWHDNATLIESRRIKLEPKPELAAKLDRDRAEAAEAMTFEQRAAMPLMLFDLVAESIRVGLRIEHPGVPENEFHQLFIARLREWKQQEQGE